MTLTDALAVLCRNHLRGWEDESQGWAIVHGAIPHGIDMATDATGRAPYVVAWETVRQHVINSRRASSIPFGFIKIGENGDPLWRFQRGDWVRRKIIDVRIGPDGKDLWIKVEEQQHG